MAQNVQVCDIDPTVMEKLKKFRFRKEKNVAAIMLKIEKNDKKVVVEEEYEANPSTNMATLAFNELSHLKHLNATTYGMNLNETLEEVNSKGIYEVYVFLADMSTKTDAKDCTIEELQAELPETQPRYLVLSYVRTHSDGRISYPLCFIFSSPSGCHPEQQMMYAGTLLTLVHAAGLTKTFDIRNTEELTEEWLLEKLSKV